MDTSDQTELGEFIEQTLHQIVRGVEKGQENISEQGKRPSFDTGDMQKSADVTFDLEVSASRSKGAKGQLGIFVTEAFGIGGKGSDTSKNEMRNRIEFTIPLKVYPVRSPEKYQ